VPRFCSARQACCPASLPHTVARCSTLHVSRDAWFAPLLTDLRGRGPTKRLRNAAPLYGFARTAESSGGKTYATSKEVWHKHKRVRDAAADAAARYLRAEAAEGRLPGPAVTTAAALGLPGNRSAEARPPIGARLRPAQTFATPLWVGAPPPLVYCATCWWVDPGAGPPPRLSGGGKCTLGVGS
jgi:hypothetical protein